MKLKHQKVAPDGEDYYLSRYKVRPHLSSRSTLGWAWNRALQWVRVPRWLRNEKFCLYGFEQSSSCDLDFEVKLADSSTISLHGMRVKFIPIWDPFEGGWCVILSKIPTLVGDWTCGCLYDLDNPLFMC